MSFQDRIKTEPGTSRKIILHYGSPGIGKTSMWSQHPKALLVEIKDHSSSALKESGGIREDLPVIVVNSWIDLLSLLQELKEENFEGLVILDGLSGAQEFVDEATIADECGGNRDNFFAFGRGEKFSAIRWQEFMDLLDDLRENGVWVVLLAHEVISTINNPAGDNWSIYAPHLSKDKVAMTNKKANAIIRSAFVTVVTSVNKESKVGKGQGGESRVLYTGPSAQWIAKNQMNLPPVINLGNSPAESFKAFSQAVKSGRNKATKE